MRTFKKLDRDYVFEKDNGIKKQHKKVKEEFNEVICETRINEDGSFVIVDVDAYVNELLDLRLAVNNLILKLIPEYSRETIKRACDNWDEKIEQYKVEKYKEELM